MSQSKDREILEEAIQALFKSITAGDSHYAHVDRQGNAGATCYACCRRRKANQAANQVIERYRQEVLGIDLARERAEDQAEWEASWEQACEEYY